MRYRCTIGVVVFTVICLVASGAVAKTVNSHTEKSFKAIPGGTVVVDVSFHDVVVTVRPGDEVRFTVDLEVTASSTKAEGLLAELEPQFSSSDSTISMRSSRSTRFQFGYFNSVEKEGKVDVVMPPGMHLEVDLASGDCRVIGDLGAAKLVLDSASGDVSLEGGADHIVADTASGDVVLDLVRPAVSVRMDTASGDATLRGGAMELHADTASGDVWASGLVGGASFDTASGNVKAQWGAVPVGVKVVADTASGGVRLRFPAGTVVGGFLGTASGDIDTDFAGQLSDRGRNFTLHGGSGEVRVKVDTASGDITVRSE